MQNGFMAKGLAGAGQGMAIAGQMAFHSQLASDLESQKAEALAKRDQVIQGYENQRNAATIQGQKDIHAADRKSAESVGLMQKEAHLEGIDKQLGAKDNKPVMVPKGSVAIATDGSVLFDNTAGDADKLMNVPEGSKVINQAGEQVFSNPKDPKAEGLDKTTKDTDHRVTLYQNMVKEHMGVGFLEKLDDTERKEFDTLLMNGADQVRKGADPEKAFRSTLDAFTNVKTRAGITGDSGTNPKVQSFRDKFKY